MKIKSKIVGIAAGLLVIFSIFSCKTLQYVPVGTGTTVNVKDSTAIHWIDSVRIHEKTRYKDLAWLGDSLQIEGQRSRMWAYADTTKECLIGGLEEDEVQEKTRIIYKDRLVYKDSIRIEEKPVPVEVEKEVKVIPKFWRVMGILGIVLSCLFLFLGFLKIQKVLPF